MSSHGKNLLGAIFRRTWGTSPPSTARQRLPRLSISSASCATNLPTRVAVGRSFSNTASSSPYRTPPSQQFVLGRPSQHATTLTCRSQQRHLVSYRYATRLCYGQTQGRTPVIPCRHDYLQLLCRQRCLPGQQYMQTRGHCDKPAKSQRKKTFGDRVGVREQLRSPDSLKETGASNATGDPPVSKHLIDRLPAIPQLHRPSKDELLAAATGFWSRLKVRFKWFSIRSGRPFNIDEISAFFSWVLVGHVLWIILGTTTFFSLAILAVNTVFAQGLLYTNPMS